MQQRYGRMNTSKSWRETRADIAVVFRRWGITDYYVHPPGGSGPMAVVEFTRNGHEVPLRCSRFDRFEDNLRAILIILDGLRLADQRGILVELAEAVSRLALPTGPPPKRRPHVVLRIDPGAPIEVAKAAHRALSQTAHPDKGGSKEAQEELNVALDDFTAAGLAR